MLNPNTRTCSVFRSLRDAELTKAIYRRVPVLIREAHGDRPEESPWGLKLSTMFHMSNDSHLFRTREQLEADGWRLGGNIFLKDGAKYLPLYEGRMVNVFDHRTASVGVNEDNTFRSGVTLGTTAEQHHVPTYCALPRYWVSERDTNASKLSDFQSQWVFGFKDITSATNERTFIGSVIPFYAVGNKVPLMLHSRALVDRPCLAPILSCFAFDFITRQKVGGVTLNFFIVKQLPVLPPQVFDSLCWWPAGAQTVRSWVRPRVLELTYTGWDLDSFAHDCGWSGPPFRWDEERRFLLRCELDAACFHLYLPAETSGDWRPTEAETAEDLAGLKASFPAPRDAVSYIMDTFPIVRRKDEEKYNGDFRTKRVILEIYDAMAQSIRTGEPYQTRLDPPPADPLCCHPPRVDRVPSAPTVEAEA